MLQKTLIYGIAGAIALGIMHILFWKIDLSLYLGMSSYIFYILLFVLLVLAQLKARTLLNGFIEYSEALKVYVVNAAIAILGNAVVAYVIYNIIDPQAQETLKELTLEMAREMAEKMGNILGVDMSATMDSGIMEQAMAEQPGQFEFSSLLLNSIVLLVMYTIGGLISSAIIKRKTPATFD